MPRPRGKRSARSDINSDSTPAVTSSLTLSHSLVQFLSLLQLQGYVAQLVNECDIHHMDDLAARVTCEQDVEKVLGPQSSLQHQQEFWRGLCKWKQTARKRPREVLLPKKVPVRIADIPFVETEGACEKVSINSTTSRFAKAKDHTASQFMRQFAFQGYEGRASPTRDNEKQQVEQQEKISELHTVCHGAAEGVEEVEELQHDKCAAAAVVQLSIVSSTGSSLWSASGCGFSQAILGGNTLCDRLPLAALAVGSGVANTEEDIFAEEWGFKTDLEEEDSNEKESVKVGEENDSVKDVMEEKSCSRSDDEIEQQCRAEYIQLQENLRGTLERAVVAYNDGLRALQQKIHASLSSAPSALVRPSILEVTRKPALRVSLHPAVSELNEVQSSARVLLESHNNVQTTTGRRSDPQRFSLVDRIVLSPPSCPSYVESVDAVPSPLGITTPARGSRFPLIEAEDVQHNVATPRATLQSGTNPALTISLSFMSGEDTAGNPNPVVSNDGSGEMPLLTSGSSQIASLGSAHLLDSHQGVEEEQPKRASRTSFGSNFLEEFGLQALTQAPKNRDQQGVGDRTCFHRSATPQMTGTVESMVIDVDALSLTPTEDERDAVLAPDDEDNVETEDEDAELVRAAHSEDYTSPLVTTNFPSLEDTLIGPLTQVLPRRQPAVPRSDSISPPPLSLLPFVHEPHSQQFTQSTVDETTIGPTALDWTTASSIAADLRCLEGVRLPAREGSTPQGRPPLPSKPNELRATADGLTAAGIDALDCAALRDLCQRLGLRLPTVRNGDAKGDEGDAVSCAADSSLAQDETSTGWWARAAYASRAGSSDIFNSSDKEEGDDEEEEDEEEEAAAAEEMREALRVLVARRTFMDTVVPFFLHRLPRFSGGPQYTRPRVADAVQAHTALTQNELDERRRIARADEAAEMDCCVLTSLVANAVERTESFARRRVGRDKGGFAAAQGDGLTVYEKLLLMEPTDLQAAAEIVRADFPFVTRHRIKTMLDESGIPLDTTQRVYQQPNSQCTNEPDRSCNATQRTVSSCSPPPPPTTTTSPLRQSQLDAKGAADNGKRQFFAQRGWLRRAHGR